MPRVTLNKTALKQERDKIRLYEQYLPSLDLKRQQFLFELRKAGQERDATREAISRLENRGADWIALLGNEEFDPSGLVKMESLILGEQNLLGIKLPTLEDLRISTGEYSMLARPVWVDALVDALYETAELRIRLQIQEERLRRLKKALATITQRVNLFDKILIPETRENIRSIQVALGDTERSGVVRAKIAKAKHQAESF
ncbi:MAG: V-type ATP synthase subunit D [Desulfurivibrionaceae bacterium]|nr:V-type ATP synthase subunit D [Desulfobulbales bacterium]MDT8334062.1 V-type ATP synthase subunit D [Desulfurivibrionaceae bacterium]